MDVVWATLQAALGAANMTEHNEALNPSRYRQARALNREGRRALVALGASASEALELVLLG